MYFGFYLFCLIPKVFRNFHIVIIVVIVLHVRTWIQILVYLFILQEHNFHPVEIKYGLLQLAEGLSFLHDDARLFHGNLTPENVIINHKGEWKLGGFHFCCYAQYTSSAQVRMYYHITLVHTHACTYTYTHTHTHTHNTCTCVQTHKPCNFETAYPVVQPLDRSMYSSYHPTKARSIALPASIEFRQRKRNLQKGG